MTIFLRMAAVLAVLCSGACLAAGAADSNPAIHAVLPAEIDGPVNNPYMGWGLWAGLRYYDGKVFTLDYNTTGFGDDAPLFSWVLVDWMWADLEPEEGKYYWNDLDAILHYWGSRGKQVDLRVWVTDDPGWNDDPGSEACPEWLWKTGVRYREYTGEGKSRKREPDYVDPSYEKIYLPKLRRFLTALAQRYDKPDSPIVMWGVMGYGQWGEWHTLWSKYPWPSREAKHNVLASIVNMYAEIFKNKLPCISYCHDTDLSQVTDLDDYMYRQALDVAIPKGWALARHAFIDALRFWDRKVMQTYWQAQPMLAESNWSYTDLKNHRRHGSLDEYLDVFREWHSTYAHYYMDSGSYKRAMKEDRRHFEQGLESGGIGYRFVLTRVSWSEQVPAGHLFVVRHQWVNRNAGLLYQQHPLKIYLTDSEGNEKYSQVDRAFDQAGWEAGQVYRVVSVFRLPKTLQPGLYDVRVAMVDASGTPRIRLAIEGADSQGRYRLGTIRVVSP